MHQLYSTEWLKDYEFWPQENIEVIMAYIKISYEYQSKGNIIRFKW
jgi:hypothetical protein